MLPLCRGESCVPCAATFASCRRLNTFRRPKRRRPRWQSRPGPSETSGRAAWNSPPRRRGLFRQSDVQRTGYRRARGSVAACGADAPEVSTRRSAERSNDLCYVRVWMHKGRAVYSRCWCCQGSGNPVALSAPCACEHLIFFCHVCFYGIPSISDALSARTGDRSSPSCRLPDITPKRSRVDRRFSSAITSRPGWATPRADCARIPAMPTADCARAPSPARATSAPARDHAPPPRMPARAPDRAHPPHPPPQHI